eukprot:362298-Chlamydomonas_euryale.AAC.5
MCGLTGLRSCVLASMPADGGVRDSGSGGVGVGGDGGGRVGVGVGVVGGGDGGGGGRSGGGGHRRWWWWCPRLEDAKVRHVSEHFRPLSPDAGFVCISTVRPQDSNYRNYYIRVVELDINP